MSGIVLAPQRLVVTAYNAITNSTYFDDLDALKEENIELRKQIELLNQNSMDYDLIKNQNRLYKQKEEFKNDYSDYDVLIAEIISISSNNFERTFVINKGYEDGIRAQMPVITKDGLVGYVSKISKNTSNVVAIVDASTLFSARNFRTKDLFVVGGTMDLMNDNKLMATDIPFGSTFESGDVIETSGMGGVFPKGLTIGRITQVEFKTNPLENTCIINTAVDFDKLEIVAVIIDNKEN